MTTYVALLRGINVGGRTKILMADLRQLFLALGHADVQTYVQSGNVIFTSQARDPSRLARDIEKRLAEDLGVSSTVLLRTGTDLARIVANNPFLGPNTDPATLHVTFLAETPNPEQIARLDALPRGPDKLALV